MRLRGTNERFERLVMAHMDAAYNLAYWITRDPHEAEEAVQEAMLRAYRFFDSFHGENGKAWLLGIVRNTCYTLYNRNRVSRQQEVFDARSSILPTGQPGSPASPTPKRRRSGMPSGSWSPGPSRPCRWSTERC